MFFQLLCQSCALDFQFIIFKLKLKGDTYEKRKNKSVDLLF